MPAKQVPSWLGLLESRSFLCARGQLLKPSEIFIFFCILVLWVCVIPCRSYKIEEVYQSSKSHRKCTTTFCRDKQSFPALPLVKLGGSSDSCCSPSKAELVAGSRNGNWFKMVGISFRSKKCNSSQGWETFLRISRKEASVSAGGEWRAVETLAVAVAHFFHDHSILGAWFLAWD